MQQLLPYVLLFIGAGFFVWGFFIVGSDAFFNYWQDRYWKEKNDSHLTKRSVSYNRYGTGLLTGLLGAGMIYFVFNHFV